MINWLTKINCLLLYERGSEKFRWWLFRNCLDIPFIWHNGFKKYWELRKWRAPQFWLFRKTLHEVHCTIHSMKFTLWMKLYEIHPAKNNLWNSPCETNFMKFTVWKTLHEVHCAIHFMKFTLWKKLYEIHPAKQTSWNSPCEIHLMKFTLWNRPYEIHPVK